MSEKIPDTIKDLGKYRLEKENRKKEDSNFTVSPEGYLIYPESTVEISHTDTFHIAKKFIDAYKNEDVLLSAERLWEETRASSTLHKFSSDIASVSHISYSLNAQLERHAQSLAHATIGNLVQIVEIHKNSPSHFSPLYFFAVSKELTKRFEVAKSS